jgi:hypothetical protein
MKSGVLLPTTLFPGYASSEGVDYVMDRDRYAATV